MIIMTICKILILTAKIIILSLLIPFVWIYAVLVNFIEWIKQEWMMMGMPDDEKRLMHDKLLASYVGCRYEKKGDGKIIKKHFEEGKHK